MESTHSKLSYLILVCLQHDAVHHMSEKQPEYSGAPAGMQKKKIFYTCLRAEQNWGISYKKRKKEMHWE